MSIKGIIYKIICNITGNIYIGSTFKTLEHRLSLHVAGYKFYLNTKKNFVTSFNIIKNNNYQIECIEEVYDVSKVELKMLEQRYILSSKCVNKNIPCRKYKEWYLYNRNRVLDFYKKYYLDNKEHMLSKRKLYYENHREEIRQKYLNKKRLNHSNELI
jgi:hypothetical protein